MGGRSGTAARLVGSVFAHRMFDLFPVTLLVVWVLLEAKIPQWAYLSIEVALGVGVLLFVLTVLLARRQSSVREGVGRLRLLWARARQGLAVMRRPAAAATATAYQTSGWRCGRRCSRSTSISRWSPPGSCSC